MARCDESGAPCIKLQAQPIRCLCGNQGASCLYVSTIGDAYRGGSGASFTHLSLYFSKMSSRSISCGFAEAQQGPLGTRLHKIPYCKIPVRYLPTTPRNLEVGRPHRGSLGQFTVIDKGIVCKLGWEGTAAETWPLFR